VTGVGWGRGGGVSGRWGNARRTWLQFMSLTTKPPSGVVATPQGIAMNPRVAGPPSPKSRWQSVQSALQTLARRPPPATVEIVFVAADAVCGTARAPPTAQGAGPRA